jgi:hypothetical protein
MMMRKREAVDDDEKGEKGGEATRKGLIKGEAGMRLGICMRAVSENPRLV